MKKFAANTCTILLVVLSVFLFACNSQSTSDETKSFEGKWQGMTYGTGPYDPMFTCQIEPGGTWTDLTFGEAKAVKSKYEFDKNAGTITLFTAAGNKLYTFKLEPAANGQKERLIEQLPANETYRAMICYRKV